MMRSGSDSPSAPTASPAPGAPPARPGVTRRGAGLAIGAGLALPLGLATPGRAQAPAAARFSFEDVLRRARDLALTPAEPAPPSLPEPIARLDFDAWRDIRFRPERAFLGAGANGGRFRMHMFHLGHLFRWPVTVNIVRDGVATPVAYAPALFDYGRNRIDRPLPLDLGFAGFRLHYPLNDPRVFDEMISFIGSSYFRVLGRGQHYGLSARGLAINAGLRDQPEEFPVFHEFWVEQPRPDADRVEILALMDSASLTGAYRFTVTPGVETTVDVLATLFPRRAVTKLGLAPLTSMYVTGENDRRVRDDYRPELHDSDGLLIHSGTGEWIWRPLRNPSEPTVSSFRETNPRGFGLMQRDRTFEHYQDLDLHYHQRPSYFVEPRGSWGEGFVELIELPTLDETNDNIVALWVPQTPLEPGRAFEFGYRLRSLMGERERLHPGGLVLNTYGTAARALGSAEQALPGSKRFIVDFVGGDLAYYASEPGAVEVVASTTQGQVTRSFLVPNPHTEGFRAGIDVVLEPGRSTDLRAFLRSGSRTLTETWTMPWTAPAP